MASRAAAQLLSASPSPPLPSQPTPPKPSAASPPAPLRGRTTRRTAATAALVAAFLAGATPLLVQKPARSFEFGFTAPDQTPEEAEAGIKIHSRGILQLRQLVESQAWRELQLALRESSSLLKQDLYTIIQTKPGGQRPLLRKLYSTLFNNVTRMDYAARSEDAGLVQEHYQTVVATLEEILGRISTDM
ncbi:hypothetical protein Taro_010910 [Colocasia esculenta]|uniref:PsbQ-like protein 3, chloroplastic n=1 Tax=Colocasia esculenta TaxID=4460 RepID=A0A843UB21_COLES|nr:hypothetical protein [Colocasia esculenta]